MTSKSFKRIDIVMAWYVLVTCLCVCDCGAQPRVDSARGKNSPVLTVEGDPDRGADSSIGMHNFGTIDLVGILRPPGTSGAASSQDGRVLALESLKQLEHTFVLKNISRNEIEIGDVQSNCGCTIPQFVDPQYPTFPLKVSPGEEIKVKVTIDPTLVQSGHVQHYVSLLLSGREESVAMLYMRGSVRNGFRIAEGKTGADLRRLPAVSVGQRLQKIVVLKIDKRIPNFFEAGTKFRLVSSDPRVKIRLLTLSAAQRRASAEIRVADDTFSFTNGAKSLESEANVSFLVEVSGQMPSKASKATFVLATDKAGVYGIHRHMEFPLGE